MRLVCNLDACGKAVRLLSGICFAAAGLILLLIAVLGGLAGWWPWLAGAVALVFGGFQIFEARAGWCVVRALGFKTPI